MNRRTFEGHMDWEYQNPRPIDPTSPFGQLSQKAPMTTFSSRAQYNAFSQDRPNPFATGARTASSPSKTEQSMPAPPSSVFHPPPLPKQPSALHFRNPAFTTPQKRFESEPLSECSAAEDSPAVTDASEYPGDTPEVERMEQLSQMALTPARADQSLASRLFSRGHMSGRGELPRGRADPYLRDKVRKRKRQHGDKDVGGARARVSHESDESDSDWVEGAHRGRNERSRGGKQAARQDGLLRNVLGALHDHPNIPAILAGYMHLMVWVLLVSLGLYCLWGFITTFRSDIALAGDQARAELLEEMRRCSLDYAANRCSSRDRAPALADLCSEWDTCMHQDAGRIHQFQVSAKNMAEIINEFAGVLSLKAYGLIVTMVVLCLLATRGFSSMSRNKFYTPSLDPSVASLAQPNLASPAAKLHPASYFPHTPGRVKAIFFSDDATDSDASPSGMRAIMPPSTPSPRKSPSKGDRSHSPTKRQ